MSKKVKVEGEGEEVRGKVEEAHERLHERAAEMDKPQGETYEATSTGFVRWCVDRNIRRPVMLWKDYCDIANLAAKIDEAGGAASALCEAMNQIRAEYFDNIKQFLIDCSQGVTRDKFRKPFPSQEFWRTGIESYSRERLSPRQRRLIQKNTRSEAEAADYMKSLEKTRLDNLGKFLQPKASGEEGKGKGKKG